MDVYNDSFSCLIVPDFDRSRTLEMQRLCLLLANNLHRRFLTVASWGYLLAFEVFNHTLPEILSLEILAL